MKKRNQLSESHFTEMELYRQAADALKKEKYDVYRESVRKVYVYEENRVSNRRIHTAEEKIHAMLKVDLKLSLLLLEDGYEDAAVNNIWQAIKNTHRGAQLRMCERLNCNIWL